MVKNPSANAGDVGDVGSLPGSGRSPGGGHGNPLQYSCLENAMNRGAWWTTIHVVAESDRTEQLTLSLFPRVVKGVPAGWSAIEGSWRAGH